MSESFRSLAAWEGEWDSIINVWSGHRAGAKGAFFGLATTLPFPGEGGLRKCQFLYFVDRWFLLLSGVVVFRTSRNDVRFTKTIPYSVWVGHDRNGRAPAIERITRVLIF